MGGNLKKIGGDTEKKTCAKKGKTRKVKSLNSVRFEILKNQSSIKQLEINDCDVIKNLHRLTRHDLKQYMKNWVEI